jgi:hypothetical protein
MDDTWEDEIGRLHCAEHHRDRCHECCFDFRQTNVFVEEAAGLRKPRTPLQELAVEMAALQHGLAHMRQDPRAGGNFAEKNMASHEENLTRVKSEVAALLDAGGAAAQTEWATALSGEMDLLAASDAERNAVMAQWSIENPGKTTMEWGGSDHQRLFEQFAANAPSTASVAAPDVRTCDWCKAPAGATKLLRCSRCRKVAYCNAECQRQAWKGHKGACKKKHAATAAAVEKRKKLPMTWRQLEMHGVGVPATGQVLEVRVLTDESMMRQVFGCKDREGTVRRIAAYTDSRSIPGLGAGKVLRWKNPRFHMFMDGSAGARIEEGDLPHITILS